MGRYVWRCYISLYLPWCFVFCYPWSSDLCLCALPIPGENNEVLTCPWQRFLISLFYPQTVFKNNVYDVFVYYWRIDRHFVLLQTATNQVRLLHQ